MVEKYKKKFDNGVWTDMIYLFIIISLLLFELYKRYMPIKGIVHCDADDIDQNGEMVLLDIRDYQEAENSPIPGAINVPFAYVKRYYGTIPQKPIHLIASNCMEKNIGIRYLRKYGFSVQSCTITGKTCKEKFASVL